MQKEGAHKLLKDSDRISFSKDVAETLGIEAAIILELYQQNKITYSDDSELFKSLVKQKLPFIEHALIEACLKKLLHYKLISNTQKTINKKNYDIKPAQANNAKKLKIDTNWSPSNEALEILNMGEIPEIFISSKVKEFVLYWSERGQERNNWNTSFIDYIRREWAKEQSSTKGLPHTIDFEWSPSNDAYDILELSDISKESASKYLREFILYWKENGSAFTTWNSKFIEHVKRRHVSDNQNLKNEENQKHTEPGKYGKDFSARKGDSSWASEIKFE